MLENIRLAFMLILCIISIVVVLGLFAAKIHCGLTYGDLPITELPSICIMLMGN